VIRIIRSESLDPFENLALEEWLFDSLEAGDRVLLLWRDSPCVVIGRFQNPWVECSLRDATELGAPIVRRRSGGGCVYHDGGNLCYSFISPKDSMDRRANCALLASALQSLGIPAVPTERFDLFLQGKKISGSALRESRGKACHHGTVLVSSELAALRRLLSVTDRGIRTKGVPSRPSPVMNLSEAEGGKSCDVEKVASALETVFSARASSIREVVRSPLKELGEVIETRRKMLASWEWRFGASPDFDQVQDLSLTGNEGSSARMSLSITAGCVAAAHVQSEDGEIFPFPELRGTRYVQQDLSTMLRRLIDEGGTAQRAAALAVAAKAVASGVLGC